MLWQKYNSENGIKKETANFKIKDMENINSIHEQENNLFQEWAIEGYRDYRDGVVNEVEWRKSTKLKVLFILKETNGGRGDLRSYLRGEEKSINWRTYNNIARWADGLRNINNNPKTFRDVEKINNQDIIKKLAPTVVINIKKKAGGNISDSKELIEFVDNERNREFLKKQIQLYYKDIDIIVCCGKDIIASLFLPFIDIRYERGQQLYKNDGKIIVNYYHPNNTKKTSREMFQELTDLETV